MSNMRKRVLVHGLVAFTQVALSIPALLWWKNSVLFVIGLSLFANFYSAVSALEAADDSKVMKRLDELERNILEQKKSSASEARNEAVEGVS